MKETTPTAMPPCFEKWCQRFDNLFSHKAQKREFRHYLGGLLGESERKNLSQIAENAVGVNYHRLHHFLTDAPWSSSLVNERRLQVMNKCSQTRISRGFSLIIDDSGHRKSGNFTQGVGRQYIGEIGKTDNGLVVVTSHLYDGRKSLPLDIELYQHADSLPEGKQDPLFEKKTEIAIKLDVLDCQWLQQLHTYGLLSGSFRPQEQICVLRSYIRQRDNLIKSVGVHIQRMQKALTQMNLQLHRVISDITGTTGMAIIRAIVAGERNPDVLASYRDGRIKASCTEIAAALTGDYRPELIFILQQELQLYDFFQTQISACDAQIQQCLASFESLVDVNASPLAKPKRRGKKQPGNAPQFDLRGELYRMSGVDFTQIDGLGAVTVLTLISELGLDATRFPTVKHFTSWLGLCPGSRITGGKVKSSKSRPVVNRVATALRTAAQSLYRSRSALGGFYRRLAARLGAPKAITATAHKLARIFYRLWTTGNAYTDPGLDAYEQQYRERTLKNLKKKAQAFGLELTPISDSTECVS